MFVMSICYDLSQSAHEKVPNSLIIAYDDSFKPIENVIHDSNFFVNLITAVNYFQIPFPAITFVPQYIRSLRLYNPYFFGQ